MRHHRSNCHYFASGFSLLEFAIVIAIFAMLIGSLLVPLSKQIEQQRFAETERILAAAREALVSFAAANGRLPCPAVHPPQAGTPPGAEAFQGPPSSGNSANGRCTTNLSGYLPAATLGFTPVDNEGYAVDAWGLAKNRIRYAVSPVAIPTSSTNPPFVFTQVDGIKNLASLAPPFAPVADPIKAISDGTNKFLYVCADKPNPVGGADCGVGVTPLADGNAIAVIYSLGANAADPPSATEQVNYFDDSTSKTDSLFVSHGLRATNEVFDDIVTWIGPNLLIGRMIAAGRLP